MKDIVAFFLLFAVLATLGYWLDTNHPLPKPPCECTCERP